MPETPEEFYARTKDALRMPPVEEWETWPFEGDLRPRALRPPAEDELGPLMQRIERAMRSVGEIGRVHIARWGEGSEHLHWWFMARPSRMRQLSDSFAAVWDEVLPPVPDEIWRENAGIVAAALRT